MLIDSEKATQTLPTPEYTPDHSPVQSNFNSRINTNSDSSLRTSTAQSHLQNEEKLRIGITGSGGLVGKTVVALALRKGHSVLAMDIFDSNNESTKLPKDLIEYINDDNDDNKIEYKYEKVSSLDYISYKKACKEFGCNALIHLAMIPNGNDLDDRVNPNEEEFKGNPQHEVHNQNVSMSYNTLSIAAELGINRIVLASSVNAIGLLFSKTRVFDYLPLDENHPCRPEDAYSMSKYFCELQADSFVRLHPEMRIATLRFHGVMSDDKSNKRYLNENHKGHWKDLWGWVSCKGVSKACLSSLAIPMNDQNFGVGQHESFFITSPTICQQVNTITLLEKYYPELFKENSKCKFDKEYFTKGNKGLFDCSKAKRLLGWEEVGFYYEG
ncbi:uncharacterized protein L201_003166 [Kwoniella dendrophila CBS 6074]|uniref:NAD-dependent epimerase/dehydratase domain-containing protein n=1 Tax=Kwoniella dendrophila CBS 6074 TaxID=1295534 RepID=A0AAX4JSJ0_9TREE